MTPENWRRIKPHFYRALDLSSAARETLLRNLESTEPETARKVRQLLANHENNSGFLCEPVWAAYPEQSLEDKWSIEPGTVLAGRFEIRARLGRGGDGEVYEAIDLSHNKRVALKTLRPCDSAMPGARQRLTQELTSAIGIGHANICQFFDLFLPAGVEAAPVFFTMEFLQGETLAQRIRRGPIASGEAQDLVNQIASGLAAAHEKGIIHRDLKPGNIMLVPAGECVRVVIMDFGLAHKEQSCGGTAPVVSAFAGTPPYMAPEQMRGERATVQSDIHALGTLMFEMITGRLPFEGVTPIALAAERMKRDVPSPRKYVKDLDARWVTTILACVDRDPARRPASVSDVVSLLKSEPARTWSRRDLILAAGFGCPATAWTACSVLHPRFARCHRRRGRHS